MDRTPTPARPLDLGSCILVRLEPRTTAVVEGRVRVDALAPFLTRAFVEVAQALRQQGIAVRGPSFACYHGMDGDLTNVEAGFVVDVEVSPTGGVRPSELPGGPAVVGLHHGRPESVTETYERIHDWMTGHRLMPGRTVWEEYLTATAADAPGSAPLTRVVWPVSELRLV